MLLLELLAGGGVVVGGGAGVARLGSRGGGVFVVAVAVAVFLFFEVFGSFEGFPVHACNVKMLDDRGVVEYFART